MLLLLLLLLLLSFCIVRALQFNMLWRASWGATLRLQVAAAMGACKMYFTQLPALHLCPAPPPTNSHPAT